MLFDEYREECENIRHSLTNSANECMLLCPVRIRSLVRCFRYTCAGCPGQCTADTCPEREKWEEKP